MAYSHRFPETFRDEMDDIMGLLSTLKPTTRVALDPRPAWDVLADILAKTTEPLTLISLGGFSNVARMMAAHPQAQLGRIDSIVAMAGAVYVDGNVAALNNAKPEWDQGEAYRSNTYAEWNVFVDPLAAQRVLASDIPLKLVPLDACNHVLLDAAYAAQIDDSRPGDAMARLVKAVFEKKSGSHSEGIPVPIFDPLATLIALGDMPVGFESQAQLAVEMGVQTQDNHVGQLLTRDQGQRAAQVVHGVSQVAFARQYAAVINRRLP